MITSAKIIADSVAPNGERLTTFELSYPRICHSELMTHRVFSRNASSSRAIPVLTVLRHVLKNMFVPKYLGKAQKRQGKHEEAIKYYKASIEIYQELNDMSGEALILNNIGAVYKSISNKEFYKCIGIIPYLSLKCTPHF